MADQPVTDLSSHNPTARFSGLAELYARCRPSYPAEALNFIMAHCGLQRGSIVIDVGSGTGISTRLLSQYGLQVIGIEPNAEMRSQAEAEKLSSDFPPPQYCEGKGEATGLADSMADAVVSAQAFHWLDHDLALREFQRILKPGGWVVLLWNERDNLDAFTAAFSAVIRSAPNAARIEDARAGSGEALLLSPRYHHAFKKIFSHGQSFDEQGMLGRAFSSSYAPRDPETANRFANDLREVFSRFQRDGMVTLRYETSLFLAQHPGL